MMILLTGASGFVGKSVLKYAVERGFKVRPAYRSIGLFNGNTESVLVTERDGKVDWLQGLQDVDVVIHLAARVHIMDEETDDPLAEFRRVNVQGTMNLARQAALAGIKRFLFISTIKVNGEATILGHPFNADDTPAPEDPYAQSKAEAEEQLKQLAQESGMEITIIRPPLIYGPGVKGNFASLLSWVRRGLPLPFGGVTQNRRSLVGIENLVDLILVCTSHPKAAHQTFLISDGEDLSTAELLNKIGASFGRPARLFWVPAQVMSFMLLLFRKKVIAQRLLGSLQIDIRKTCDLLDWKPSVAVDKGLRETIE